MRKIEGHHAVAGGMMLTFDCELVQRRPLLPIALVALLFGCKRIRIIFQFQIHSKWLPRICASIAMDGFERDIGARRVLPKKLVGCARGLATLAMQFKFQQL